MIALKLCLRKNKKNRSDLIRFATVFLCLDNVRYKKNRHRGDDDSRMCHVLVVSDMYNMYRWCQ